MMLINYMEALKKGFPTVEAKCLGSALIYENLIWVSGDTIPTKNVLDAYVLQETRNIIWSRIQTERDRRKFNGVKVGDYWFHSDDSSRIQQIGLVIMGMSNQLPPINWKTLNGTFVTMTPELATGIFMSTAQQDIALFTIAEQHRQQMMASEDPGSYNYLTSSPAWPLTFGE